MTDAPTDAPRGLARAWQRFLELWAIVVGLGIGFAMLSVTAEVIGRYFFARPIGWVLEVTEHILFATPFLAMAWLVNRAEGHVRVDIVVNALAPRPKSALNAAVALIGVAVCGVGTYYAGITAWDHYLRNVETYGIYPIPKWTLIQIIALGFAMTTVEFARMFVRHVREWRALADDPAAGG